jgi:hypothetical protein
MSADATVVFYGAQITIPESEVENCELRTHPLMKAAKAVGLDTYWADFIPDDGAQTEMLVGRRWGVFGIEDSLEAHIERGTVNLTMDKVDAFLAAAGLPSPGKMIVRFLQNQ